MAIQSLSSNLWRHKTVWNVDKAWIVFVYLLEAVFEWIVFQSNTEPEKEDTLSYMRIEQTKKSLCIRAVWVESADFILTIHLK